MFGCTAIYIKEKIVLILRDKPDHQSSNGVWLATEVSHHESLKKDLPSLRSIKVFGAKITAWQNIPAESDFFEEEVLKACSLILKKDIRIGKIPKKKAPKKQGSRV